MMSSERFSAGLFSRDRPFHRSRGATHDLLYRNGLRENPEHFSFLFTGNGENIGCPRTPTVDRLREEYFDTLLQMKNCNNSMNHQAI